MAGACGRRTRHSWNIRWHLRYSPDHESVMPVDPWHPNCAILVTDRAMELQSRHLLHRDFAALAAGNEKIVGRRRRRHDRGLRAFHAIAAIALGAVEGLVCRADQRLRVEAAF